MATSPVGGFAVSGLGVGVDSGLFVGVELGVGLGVVVGVFVGLIVGEGETIFVDALKEEPLFGFPKKFPKFIISNAVKAQPVSKNTLNILSDFQIVFTDFYRF